MFTFQHNITHQWDIVISGSTHQCVYYWQECTEGEGGGGGGGGGREGWGAPSGRYIIYI